MTSQEYFQDLQRIISNFPHHKHDAENVTYPSRMMDLAQVLEEISNLI